MRYDERLLTLIILSYLGLSEVIEIIQNEEKADWCRNLSKRHNIGCTTIYLSD
jgi:hypothetical protein